MEISVSKMSCVPKNCSELVNKMSICSYVTFVGKIRLGFEGSSWISVSRWWRVSGVGWMGEYHSILKDEKSRLEVVLLKNIICIENGEQFEIDSSLVHVSMS